MYKSFNKIKYFFILFSLFLPSVFAFGSDIVTLGNPLGKTKTFSALANELLEVVRMIATPIAVLAIIYSGFLFVKAQGNPEALKQAQQTFKWTLIGVAVLLGAQLLATIITGTITSL